MKSGKVKLVGTFLRYSRYLRIDRRGALTISDKNNRVKRIVLPHDILQVYNNGNALIVNTNDKQFTFKTSEASKWSQTIRNQLYS